MRDAGLRRLGVVCSHCSTVIALPESSAPDRERESIRMSCPSCGRDGLYPNSVIGTLIGSEELEWKESWLMRVWRRLRAPA